MFADGIFIHLAKNVQLDKPIQIIQLTAADEPIFVLPRVLVVAEDGSNITLIGITPETSENLDVFINTVTEVHCGKNAFVHLTQIYDNSQISTVHHTEAHVHTHGNFSHYAMHLNGKLIRNNLNIVLADSNCEAHLFGYYHPTGEQVFDSHTLVDHRMPHCESNELYKGVVDGNGTAIFNGKVYVRQDAQKTNAYQSNKNILLSEDATVNTKPQLEIYADDVKCSHGSSTGVLDPEQMFYLRSRGISTPKARALLLNAYAGEILEKLPSEKLRNTLAELLQERYSA
jgi:Fe-S cluster assembly protein SufD